MRFVLRLLLLIAVALGVGFGLSYYALTDGRLFGAAQIGPWTAWPDVGAPEPKPYTRGQLVREAALQLGRAEGLQFVSNTDSEGMPLDLACAYRLDGHVPMSSFWTLSAVDTDWVSLAAPGTSPSIRSSELVRSDDGAMHLEVGTRLASGNWYELVGTGTFRLVITLYDTTAFSGFGGDGTTMPSITRGDCA